MFADQMVPLAYSNLPATGGLALLLRLSWLEPTEARADFLRQYPPARVHVLPRHDFKGRGSTDSVTSAWMVWDENEARRGGVTVVTREERQELKAEWMRKVGQRA